MVEAMLIQNKSRSTPILPGSGPVAMLANLCNRIVPPKDPAIVSKKDILKYHVKSVSQFELRRSKHSGGQQLRPRALECHSKVLSLLPPQNFMPTAELVPKGSQDRFRKELFPKKVSISEENAAKLSGMRIYTTIMLNAWRKRRGQAKRLTDEVQVLKGNSMRAKNQVHVLNALFRVEQNRNNELVLNLKRLQEEMQQTENSCANIANSMVRVQATKNVIQMRLEQKAKEYAEVNTELSDTKADLFKSMTEQRELQTMLSNEQRKLQDLQLQNTDLGKELAHRTVAVLAAEEKMIQDVKNKETELVAANNKISVLNTKLIELQKTEAMERAFVDSNIKLKDQLDALKEEINSLQNAFESVYINRLKQFWRDSSVYKETIFQVLHLVAFCMLPAVPAPKPPSFPINIMMGKFLSFVKR